MCHRLDVDRMLTEISTKLFDEWVAYGELEPFDETRADQRAGAIVAAVYNHSRGDAPAMSLREATPLFGMDVPEAQRQETTPEERNASDWSRALDEMRRYRAQVGIKERVRKPKAKRVRTRKNG